MSAMQTGKRRLEGMCLEHDQAEKQKSAFILAITPMPFHVSMFVLSVYLLDSLLLLLHVYLYFTSLSLFFWDGYED